MSKDAIIHRLQCPEDPGQLYGFWCPGCRCGHWFRVGCKGSWTWNGDLDKPTVHPSLKTTDGQGHVCHLFVTNGQIQFLADCTHHLRGQTVAMELF